MISVELSSLEGEENLVSKLLKTESLNFLVHDNFWFCRLTLLLGPPSSGKTTLLLALAGKLDSDLKVWN